MTINKSFRVDQTEAKIHRFRLVLLVAIFLILTMMLVLRLGFLQFSEYKRFANLSLKNQISLKPIGPTRGIILDRNGVVLAENIPVYALEVIVERVKNLNETLKLLQKLLPSISDDDIDNFLHAVKQNRSYMPIVLKLKLTEEDVAIFVSNQYLFPGVSIKAELMRYYPLGEVTAHALGYVGRINLQELNKVDYKNYRATNFIGKAGIEKYYEKELHGHIGYQKVETDVSGRTLGVISKKPPVPGNKLYISLDSKLQQKAHKELKGKRGAVVVLDVKNGDVLALASSPSYDPNLFVRGISRTEYAKLATSPDNPLFNRAVRGLYPPASTIKPFVAIAGLDSGNLNPKNKIYDPGWFKITGNNHKYRDWRRTGHGFVDLERAIIVSCDTYFYQLGNKLGIDKIENMLKHFGFGLLTHIDLHEEIAGVIPGREWKKHTKGQIWYPGDTIISAIGQGFMLATPLQLANATAALAMQGHRYRPHLLSAKMEPQDKKLKYKPIEEYPITTKNDEIWFLVAKAMSKVITHNEGTGHRFGRRPPYSISAKTGTAQVFSMSQDDKAKYKDLPENLRDHSLFIAFTPIENPEIAIAVIVENDHIATNIARKVIDEYYALQKRA